jgi:succinyl-diaminopimelate desuccinylase
MFVADEECGGYWGTGWLLRTYPELISDALVIGEPDSPLSLRIGQKGKAQLRLVGRGDSFPGSLGTLDDVNTHMGAALQLLRHIIDVRGTWPEELREVIQQAQEYSWTDSGKGKAWLLEHTSVNVGVLRGGTKINIVPRQAEAEIDVRIPHGVKPIEIKLRLEELLRSAGLADIAVELIQPTFEAAYTPPGHPFVELVSENVNAVTRNYPQLTLGFGSNDARYFMPHGVPSVIYGPRPYNVASVNEHITIEDLLTVTKVYSQIAIDFLCQ